MRIVSLLLIACLLIPLWPSAAVAQLSSSPLNSPADIAKIAVASSGDVLQANISDQYVLGAGDQLEAHLIVEDNALVLDYTFVVNPEGKIYFPHIDEIHISGLTLKAAKTKMIKTIKKKYKESFDFSLMVSRPKIINIYVTGQVNDTGLQTVYDGTTISQLLKKVGVAKGGSDLSEYVYLKRQSGDGAYKDYKLKLYDVFLANGSKDNMILKNGDIVAVPSIKSYVYVYGEVSRSGTFGYVPGQTLSDYINMAGGPTSRANLSGVTVTRQEEGKPKVYHINASDIIQMGMDDKDIMIYAGDVVSVPGNFFYIPDFTSFLNTIILALTLYTTVSR